MDRRGMESEGENSGAVYSNCRNTHTCIYMYSMAQYRLRHCIVLLAVRASFWKCEYCTRAATTTNNNHYIYCIYTCVCISTFMVALYVCIYIPGLDFFETEYETLNLTSPSSTYYSTNSVTVKIFELM